MSEKILSIDHISAEYRTDDGVSSVLNDISFSLNKGETLGLVGETGAGKTTTALATMRLLPKHTGFITGGEIQFEGSGNLLERTEAEMRAIRGHRISMIFQDPMTSLNPVLRIGDQIKGSFPTKKWKRKWITCWKWLVFLPAEKENIPTSFPAA